MLTAFIHTSLRRASHTTLQTLTDDVKYNKSMLQVFILHKMYFFRPSWQVKDQDKSQITSMHNKLNACDKFKSIWLGYDVEKNLGYCYPCNKFMNISFTFTNWPTTTVYYLKCQVSMLPKSQKINVI